MKSSKTERMKKRILALILCFVMVMNNGVTIFAEEDLGTTAVEYYCGYEAHAHEEACYSKELTCTESVDPLLTCEAEVHAHEGGCYAEPALVCENTEHAHGEGCYTAHAHGEGCYTSALTCTESTDSVLTCTVAEYAHTEACYVEGVLACENTEHTHDEGCYTAHAHGDNCYTSSLACTESTDSILICTVAEYVHTEACYAEPVLTCGKAEHAHDETTCYTAAHVHGEACYTEPALICEKTEHAHEDACLQQIVLVTDGDNSEGDDNGNATPTTWSWDEENKTLTLNGAEITDVSELPELPDGTKIVVESDSSIAGGEANAITVDGAVTITGTGKLTLTGKNGIKATSVAISGITVDFSGTSDGIQVKNDVGNATVTLTGVNGAITGGYAGIFVNGECAESNASVVLDNCNLDVTSTAAKMDGKARKSGITVYVEQTENVESSITIRNSNVNATGYDAGLSNNNYVGDEDATNPASSYINIENSTVTAYGINGTWSGIFASVLGQHPDADAIITIKDSSVYAESPNTGILTSSQKGESKIVLDNSVLGVSGATALSMIQDSAQAQVAEIKNGSTYVQMTPAAVNKGEISITGGKTIVATAGDGITYDKENNYFVIPQGSTVTETYTDGTEEEYTFEKQPGGVGGSGHAKEEIWGYDVFEKWEKGDIIITTPEELIEFATLTQAGGYLGNCKDRIVKLGADIDMSGYDWYYRNAEGTVETDHRIPWFLGTFDGQGYTIKNMTYRDEYASATGMTDLAFIINGRSFLKNLHIDGIKVDTVAPAYFAGLVRDYAWEGSNSAYAENCSVKNIVINADAVLTFGGMFYRLVDGSYVKDCHVENITVNVKGALVGDNSGRNGGFVATGGEPMTFTDCSVKNLVINAESTGKLIGGFIGGASMTSKFYNCDVTGFKLNTENRVNAVGGFMATTAGSRGYGLVMENCDVTGLEINSTARISAAGGVVGYMAGMSSLARGAHDFVNCTATGSIKTGAESKTGGFAGWLYGRSGGCAVNFKNCKTSVNVTSENYGGAFVGYFAPYSSNKMDVVYNNCTASGDVFATEPVGSFLDTDEATVDGIIGGTYNYDPENEDAADEVNNVAPGYRALDNGDGTWTVFPDNGKEVVKVAFHRWNDEINGYEKWRTVEVFKDVDFFESEYDNELNYSHKGYRFANGIGELDEEADDKINNAVRAFTFWTDAPNGTELVLDNEIEVVADMNVYAAYGDYVCEIVETGVKYTTLTAAVADANASEGADTIRMLKSIDFDSDKALSITGNVTIIGNDAIDGVETISRGDYTGTLFTVPVGSSLTLDGGIVFDGSNNWTFNKDLYDKNLNNLVTGTKWSDYVASKEGGTIAKAPMFIVNGTVTANDATIQNCYSLSDANTIFSVKGADATLITEGAKITHSAIQGANAVAYMSGSKWYIKEGTVISDNFAGRNGGVCRNDGGQIYMSGGTLKDNAGWNTNGTAFMMYGKGSLLEMTGGTICGNSSVGGTSNGRCAAVYLHNHSTMNMTGGTICHNVGGSRGGIDNKGVTSVLNINRVDQDFDNPEWKESGAAAYTASNHPMIVDNKSLSNNPSHDIGHAGKFDTWWVTGGIYTQDVDEFCAEGYICIPYEDSERTDDYIVVPGYRVKYHSVEKVVTKDAETGEDVVEYETTLVRKYFHLLPRDKFWYEMDERAESYTFTDEETGKTISTWYCEKELTNEYDFENSKLEGDLDLYGEWKQTRYGYLVIEKNLTNYNETNPSAVSVFEVTAKKGDEIVFNDVVAIDMTGKGTQSVKVGPIVEGAEVTVTEVYQGASYVMTGTQPQAQSIIANTYWDDCNTYEKAKAKPVTGIDANDTTYVKFTFTNAHNDVPNGGNLSQ